MRKSTEMQMAKSSVVAIDMPTLRERSPKRPERESRQKFEGNSLLIASKLDLILVCKA